MVDRLRGFERVPVWVWAGLMAAAALVVRFPLITAEHRVTPGGDSASYMAIAQAITREGYFGGGYRTPGYPLFILAVDHLIPGGRVDNVVVAQHLLAVAFVFVVVLVGARWFDRWTGVVTGAVLAVTPVMPYLEHALLSDFVFALVVFAYALVLGRVLLSEQRLPWRLLVALGALAACAAYMRPSGQALLLAVPVATLVMTRRVRRTAEFTLIATAAFALLVSPWIVRNAVRFDQASMSTVTGDTLFVRAFEVDRMKIPTDRPTGVLAAAVQRADPELRLVTAVTRALQEQGLSSQQTLEAQQSLAQTAIWRDPLTYAWGTVEQMSALRVDPREVDVGSDVGPHLPDPPAFTAEVWEATEPLSTVWWVLSLGTFGGLLVLLARRPETRTVGIALLVTWLVLALGTAMGRGALTRYTLEFAPVAVLLASYGAVTVMRVFVRGALASRSGGA